jgi:hypothetical protein
MNFLNPWLLAGIAGIASPIIIHLLAKKQVKRVVWAAMRFLKVTVDRNKRRMTIEDLLLLVLRCLVIALLAFALARPALRSSTFAGIAAGETAVLLLDGSGSTSTTDGVVSRFEKIQKAAEQVLDGLPSGSAVAVLLVTDRVREIIPEPTRDLALARKAIRDAMRADEGTAWEPAIRKAFEVLERQPGIAKQLYILSDTQASGWGGGTEIRNVLEAAKAKVQSRIVLVRDGQEANLGITNVRLASALATTRQPLRFEVEVANFGTEEVRDVAVSLSVDGEAAGEEQIIPSLPPLGEGKTVSLFATFPEAGFHSVTAKLHSDRCTFDDTRSFALKVRREVEVLLVDGEPGSEARESEVFYLSNALTPVPPDLRADFFVKTKTIGLAEFERTVLSEFDTVALANVVDFSDAAAGALENFVRAGGGLMVFPGSRINLNFYNDRLHQTSRLLPAAFGPVRGENVDETKAERPQTFFSLQGKGYEHRMVLPWKDPRSGTLTTAQFYRAYPLIPASIKTAVDDVGPAQVVLSYADGIPAVIEQPFGAGRVLQFSSTADTAWTDLPVRPVFVPLVHRALGVLLAREEERLNVSAGSPFRYRVGTELLGREYAVVSPRQSADRVPFRRLELQQQVPLIRQDETRSAGVYGVEFRELPDAAMRFAVQPAGGESNLRELAGVDLEQLAGVAAIIPWDGQLDLKLALRRERTGTELWLPLLFAVLGLLVAETVLGNRWSRSR